jgi:hypothetical protein
LIVLLSNGKKKKTNIQKVYKSSKRRNRKEKKIAMTKRKELNLMQRRKESVDFLAMAANRRQLLGQVFRANGDQ